VAKLGSILSLGDKCDSCVILQICGSCHDDANDPGFEFEVQEKIDRQRHGTIEAGTGNPKGTSAQLPPNGVDGRFGARPAPDGVVAERAFALYDALVPSSRTADGREGVNAFLEEREPVWKGR
jgi:hypothetical protein